MENKDANLIRKMISLVEQADEKVKNKLNESEDVSVDETENPQDVDEQITKVAAADAKLLANTLKAEPALFQTLKTEVPALAKFKNSDDLIKALEAEAGSVGALNLADKFAILKQVQKVPEVALKIKGFLTDAKGVQEMGKLAFPKGTVMPADPAKLKIARETLMKSYGLEAKQADDILRSAAQKASGETKVVSQFKGKKGGDPSLNPNAGKTPTPTPNKVQAPGPGGQKIIDRWNKAKETVKNYKDGVLKKIQGLKSRLSPKQLALYGLAGYGAYELLFGDKGDEKGQDQVLGDCIANLPGVTFGIGTGDVAIAKIPDGVDEKSKGKGGLTFWPNGRVISGDLSVRGNYYCKAGQIKASVAENELNEVDYNGVHIDWDGEKKTNPVPEPEKKKSKFTPCTSFPMKFGCKSDKIREVQNCLGLELKYQTGNFGPLTQKALADKGYTSTELTEPDYIKILETCGKTTEPTKRLNAEPIKLAPRDIKQAQINLGNLKLPDIKAPEVSDDVFYNALRSNGNIIGEDGNNRIKYKGPDLDDLQLGKLDNVLKGMGYTRIKQLEDMKRYGSKYVWLKTQ
jgi:hypothetical protein